jgi:hypothetical protein
LLTWIKDADCDPGLDYEPRLSSKGRGTFHPSDFGHQKFGGLFLSIAARTGAAPAALVTRITAHSTLLLWCDRTVTSVRDGAFLQLWGSLMAALIFYAQQTGMA